jgi:hypothetical protein
LRNFLLLWNLKMHYHIHKGPYPESVESSTHSHTIFIWYHYYPSVDAYISHVVSSLLVFQQKCMYFSFFLCFLYLAHLIFLDVNTQKYLVKSIHYETFHYAGWLTIRPQFKEIITLKWTHLQIWYEAHHIGANFKFVFAIYILISAQCGCHEFISEL